MQDYKQDNLEEEYQNRYGNLMSIKQTAAKPDSFCYLLSGGCHHGLAYQSILLFDDCLMQPKKNRKNRKL
jgi:hypothetical protein